MPTTKKNWIAQSQIIGASDAWITLSGTTEIFSSDVDMETNGYEGAHVIVEMNYDAGPTDEVTINIYGSLDGTNYDDTAYASENGDKSTDPEQLSLIVRDLAHFRVGVVQAGATDSHDVRAYVQPWNYISV